MTAATTAAAPLQSPCIGVCVIDRTGSELCRGCGRTIDEIAAWGTLGPRERQAILTDIRCNRQGFEGQGFDGQGLGAQGSDGFDRHPEGDAS